MTHSESVRTQLLVFFIINFFSDFRYFAVDLFSCGTWGEGESRMYDFLYAAEDLLPLNSLSSSLDQASDSSVVHSFLHKVNVILNSVELYNLAPRFIHFIQTISTCFASTKL